MQTTGIHRRLFQWLLPPLLVLFIIGVYSDYRLAYEPGVAAYDQALADTALALSVCLKRENGQAALVLTPQADAVLRVDQEDRIYFAIFRDDGNRISGDEGLPFVGVGGADGGLDFRDTRLGDQNIRLATMRFVLDGEPVWIGVAETTRKREQLRDSIVVTVAGTDLLQILAALVIVTVGVRVGLAPLDRLRKDIERRSPRDLSPLPIYGAPEEVRPLITALNRQFSLLDESITSRDRFLADAVHQIKTPLAALQTQLDLAASEEDPSVRRRRFDQMTEATGRVSHLVRQLLTLAQADPSAEIRMQRVSVDLSDLAERIASSHLDFALTKGIDLGFELSQALIQGIPWLLQELLANLVDNALIYTLAGGSVTVRTGSRDGLPFLAVEDSGTGIPANQRDKVFDRFYRVPGSVGDGCGLGLAIAREIAIAHGATIVIDEGPSGQGTLVTVLFSGASSAPMLRELDT